MFVFQYTFTMINTKCYDIILINFLKEVTNFTNVNFLLISGSQNVSGLVQQVLGGREHKVSSKSLLSGQHDTIPDHNKVSSEAGFESATCS